MTAPLPTPERRHGIVNTTFRGVLGGWVNWCSCGASIVEPEGEHQATDAHLDGPPNLPRPKRRTSPTDRRT